MSSSNKSVMLLRLNAIVDVLCNSDVVVGAKIPSIPITIRNELNPIMAFC